MTIYLYTRINSSFQYILEKRIPTLISVILKIKTFISTCSCLCCILNNNDRNLRTRKTISSRVLLLPTYLQYCVRLRFFRRIFSTIIVVFSSTQRDYQENWKTTSSKCTIQTRFPVRKSSLHGINLNQYYTFSVKHRRLFKIHILIYLTYNKLFKSSETCIHWYL